MATTDTPRKNVLFIVIDQLRADCVHGALADHVNLPNLQALMAESVVFKNNYSVTNPCGPSRVSLLTARYAMNHRSIRNGTPLAHDTPNLATEAAKAGYDPLLFGYTDTSQDPRAYPEGHPALTTYEHPMNGFREVCEMRLEESHGWRADLRAKGYDIEGEDLFGIFRVNTPEGQPPRPNDPALYKAEDSDTAYLTNQFLEGMKDKADQPWFAHLTWIRPHPPFNAPAPYNDMYDPASLPLPERLTQEEEENFHPYMKPLHDYASIASTVEGFPDLDSSDDNVQTLRTVYLGLATEVDHHLGRVVSWLKDSGQYENTLLVVTADHGELLGDRHAWGKLAPFKGAFHTPLIIRAPGTKAREISHFTESSDITPTILDWIGTDIPASMDGRSLVPWLQGETPEWRDFSYSEFDFGNPIDPTPWQKKYGLNQSNANCAILRENRFTLVHFADGFEPMLFDSDGKGELENVAAEPEFSGEMLRLTQKLLSHRMKNTDHLLSTIMITKDGPVNTTRPRG